jgi:hypothetical protein
MLLFEAPLVRIVCEDGPVLVASGRPPCPAFKNYWWYADALGKDCRGHGYSVPGRRQIRRDLPFHGKIKRVFLDLVGPPHAHVHF